MDSSLLSVCVITYNHVNYIKEALEGVFMQKTNFSWELVIADDFSTDGTREILLKYKEKYPDIITLILQEKNVGAGQNWFDLISYPKSKYIAYFEGDDYWIDPYKLQKQVDFLEAHEDFNVVFTNTIVVNKLSETVRIGHYEDRIYTLNDVMRGFIPPTQTILFRNIQNLTLFMNQFSNFPSGDRLIAYYCALHGKIGYIPEQTAAYRDSGEGIWSSNPFYDKIKKSAINFEHFYNILGLSRNSEYCTRKQFLSFCMLLIYCIKYPKSFFKDDNFKFLIQIWKKQKHAKRLKVIFSILKDEIQKKSFVNCFKRVRKDFR
jgi:glycosyltransferase involved in cell wall biosynthesis